jgi:hypothetical protein
MQGAWAGSHVVRDDRGWKDGAFDVLGLWLVHVEPAFDPVAALAVVDPPECKRFAFAMERLRPAPLGDVESVVSESGQLPAKWHDLVAAALQSVNLREARSGAVLDGIWYRLEVHVRALSSTIEFGNPRNPGIRRLEAAMIGAARGIGEVAGSELLTEYLAVWESYVEDASVP